MNHGVDQDVIRKSQELADRTDEARTFKLKYNETLSNLDKVERKLLDMMDFDLRNRLSRSWRF